MLMAYMQHTNYENFIAPAVNKSFSFYHKVGIDDDQVNDVVIIRSKDDVLALSIMTNGHGTYDWTARAGLMQKITDMTQQAYLY
jgi:beta-lactamase class A